MTWRELPLKALAREPITNGLGLPGEHGETSWPRYIRTTDIATTTSLRTDVFASQPPEVAARARVRRGDILMTAAGATIGKSILLCEEIDACYAGFLVKFSAGDLADTRFISYWMQSAPYWAQIDQGAVRSTIDNFSAGKYRELRLHVPPIEEQRRIADFLDDQVGRLNDLAEFRAEQRSCLQEVLSDAKVRCVAPDSSGTNTRLSRMLRDSCVGVVVNPSNYFEENGVPFIHGYNVRDGWLDLSDLKFMSRESSASLSRSRLQEGDVLVVRAGYPGRAAVVPPELVGGNCASVLVLRTAQRLLPKFLEVFLNSSLGIAQVRARQYGAAQEVINLADVLDFAIPDLPLAIQETRLKTLASVQDTCEQVTQGIDKSIELFEERKRSLITAAVTGLLDVTAARPIMDLAA